MILSLEYPGSQFKILFMTRPCHHFHGEFKYYRSEDYGATAYVTFKERFALETAVLLSVSCLFLTILFSTEIKCTTLDVPIPMMASCSLS
jgi:hypothetical protein